MANFIEFCIDAQALRFGPFTLKSGRQSPYFFDIGQFQTGDALSQLGHHYAQCINAIDADFDVVFGPAYKGIPLALSTAMALSEQCKRPIPYSFNRKETKQYGDGGQIVGTPLNGKKVLIVDDVITSGKALNEAIEIIHAEGGQPIGLVVALDRQEKSLDSALSAIQCAEKQHGIPIHAITTLEQVLQHLEQHPTFSSALHPIREYLSEYGATQC